MTHELSINDDNDDDDDDGDNDGSERKIPAVLEFRPGMHQNRTSVGFVGEEAVLGLGSDDRVPHVAAVVVLDDAAENVLGMTPAHQ